MMKEEKRKPFKPLQGRLLISEPALQDFYFKQSVVLLAEHNENGSFGLIINKPISVTLNEVTRDFPSFDAPLFLGGPVKTDNIYYIHTLGNVIKESLKIMDGLYWGGDIAVIKEMMLLNQLSPNDIRFFVGYSGWASKQLDRELEGKSWVVTNAKADQIIRSNPKKMWGNLIKKFGDEYAIWANFPSDPSMN
jgi:putative transcriptional regulator